LRSRTAAELARTPYPVTAEVLADALVPAFETPLGPIASGLRLRDFGVADRLSELDFELPLAGGDRPTGARVRVADLAAVLAEHVGDHPHLHAYPAMLASEPTGEQTLRGYLTGSIDSVLRVRDDAGGPPRHLVVDYKSNWLGEFGVPLTVASYHPDRVAEAMMRAHYPLQALLYSVALHRFLSWRMPDYDPATHLGGIAYLFVRGMAGPDTPTVDQVPYGVFSWDPGPDLVIAWSQLLAGEGA
ncbi:MAG TPA: exodeoxyribonuclease V subunit beta, partial [Candidatus Avipropionibacterium avicola]|nr:exodeoxyribonuclease V subunit beta [Candidatus Avipropionibacterium avicola]